MKTLILAIAIAAHALAADVTICVTHLAKVEPDRLHVAELTATRILHDAGVNLHWLNRGACPADAIQMELWTKTPQSESPGALGIAYPFLHEGVRIVIFTDRVPPLCNCPRLPASMILGHAMAHEIGHVLLGTNAHSPSGIMKAHWTPKEWKRMSFDRLAFTPAEAAMMRDNLDRSLLARR